MKEDERKFFTQVKKAITTNPFSSERVAIDAELAGVSQSRSVDDIYQILEHKLTDATRKVIERQKNGFHRLDGHDHELLRYGVLFSLFYLHCDDYDRLIEKQVEKGENSCKVNFAKDVLQKLIKFRFTEAEALRFFALFFQMRRAFFFINRISGKSSCVQGLKKNLWNNIFTNNIELYDTYLWNRMEDFSTMLLGETGTGKGLAASAIGRSGFIPFNDRLGCFSESFAKSFVSINLSQFPEQLIESELFGHRKGAFTGAIEAYRGVFSLCSPFGAIFLDEVGDVSIPVQIKLLQVLQERKFSPVGGHTVERFQGRVIAATNQPLSMMRKAGTFRDDFYYRLCSDVIEIPPLRQRLDENPDELEIILSFIIRRILGRTSEELVNELGVFIRLNQPSNYPWPGNIRELEQCVRQILLRQDYKWQNVVEEGTTPLSIAIDQGELTAQHLLGHYCNRLYQNLGTYEAVAKVTNLDRRTVSKYITELEKS